MNPNTVSCYFIETEKEYTADREISKTNIHKTLNTYKLGEEIAYGVKYFGQESRSKAGDITAMCVCPICKELYRIELKHVRSGRKKTCSIQCTLKQKKEN